ncbi:MAG: Sorbitol-6-phosphate 2-dehydrogenase [Lentisphaerae bacterium ADurb.BinA184]|nr:MAG: Sorbitol-6-phosphate 2-dehydrogenase [Lentisphaerae bacterium ADurb.BinA184]
MAAGADWFAPAIGPLSPDHIVYAKSYPYTGELTPAAMAGFVRQHGYAPRLAAVAGRAVFGIGDSLKAARAALVAGRDAALVQQLTAAFVGPRCLDERERSFIENWEVESYRQKVGAGEAAARRVAGKVCVVTGAAQGFGLGIARGMAAEGAVVFLADLNVEGAKSEAAAICREAGAEVAFGVAVNVADEASVAAMVREVVATCGGIDVLIANAGVLRAGSLKSLSFADWELVTKVNYTGYFLCVKQVAPVMAAQNAAGAGAWSDIIQINSKSGLEGSNRNAAYAGGKFGGIGLTQSFAKELVEDRIKVNSICPGNYFEGPLWSDPERGLFVQYLRSGKVEGAQTVADVKRAYEAKVPMGRGCRPEDVLKAIFYVIEQQYETGQALPVTGGQVMLR